MAKNILILSALLLSGCSTPVIIDGTVTGNIPAPDSIKRPYLEINNLNENSTNSDKVKAINISINQLMVYSESLEKYLESYK